LTAHKPGATVRVIQGCYNTGVPQSAGTHDKDACLDVEILGWDNWYSESDWLRAHGWADWVRDPSQGFSWHHHMISRGTPLNRVGEFVPGQLLDFNRHALGLKGNHDSGSDPQCRNGHVLSPLFNYNEWKTEEEANMPLNAQDKEWLRNMVEQETKQASQAALEDFLAETVTGDDGQLVTIGTILGRMARLPNKVDAVRKAVKAVDDQVG
jgi:hypothetical protein